MGQDAETPPTDPPHTPAKWVLRLGVALAVLAVAYVAKVILIPIVGAVLLSITLGPAARWLSRHGVPRYLSAFAFAGIVTCLSLAILVTLGAMVGGWMDQAPQYLEQLNEKISGFQEPLEELAEATDGNEPEQAPQQSQTRARPPSHFWTSLDHSQREDQSDEPLVKADKALWMNVIGLVLGQSLTILTGFFICITLTFFFILSGDVFLAKLLSTMPNLTGKKEAMTIVREIEKEVSRFLGVWTLINFCVGMVVFAAFQAAGVPNAWLWGIASMLFNYIPYAGPWVLGGFALLMGLLSYDDTFRIILPAGIILAVNVVEGFIISPMVHGQRLNLNTVSVFLAVILGGWLWGIAGALMAVPILVVVYIFCSHIASLKAVALFLDDSAPGLRRGHEPDKGDASSQATPPVGESG